MSFEPFVRPYVVPSIRPAVPQLLPPEDNVEQGIAVLSGLGGKLIDLSQSQQGSVSRSHPVETQRTVTTQRVYQKKDDGTIEKENFVDVEHTTEMKMREGDGSIKRYVYANPPQANNIETIETGTVYVNEGAVQSGSGGAAP